MVHEVLKYRKVKYWNNQENVDSFTTHAVRELVLLHPVDELNLMEELGKMATVAYIKKNLNNKH